MYKQDIIDMCSVYGGDLMLFGTDVVRVSRDQKRLTFRRLWRKDKVEPKVFTNVMNAARELGKEIAEEQYQIVTIYSVNGLILDTVIPDSVPWAWR